MHDVMKAAAGAAVGGLLAWSAHSFTTDGRLLAVEKTLERIERRLDQLNTKDRP